MGGTEIASFIRREIISEKLLFNDRLPSERILAENYKVARGTIRKAITQLKKEGLVEKRPRSGTYILKINHNFSNPVISSTRPLELIDARFALEPHICRLAVLHARRRDLDNAEQILLKIDKLSESKIIEFSQLDEEFHTILTESTNNGLLISMVKQINSVRNQEQWQLMRKLTLNLQTITLYNKQHKQILSSIRSREPERAAYLMKEHLETARLSLNRAAST